MTIALLALFSYLVGSVPFGVLAARSKGIDIFAVGSGNPGATNVARALGRRWGLAVFILDVAKGVAPAVAAHILLPKGAYGVPGQIVWFGAGMCAVLGHCVSPFLHFRGGKGIATLLGVGLGMAPLVAVAGFGIFLAVCAVTRYVSLASMVAVASAVPLSWFLPGQARELVIVYVGVTVFVVYRHRANIQRLLSGTEPKFPPRPSADEKNPEGDEARPEAQP